MAQLPDAGHPRAQPATLHDVRLERLQALSRLLDTAFRVPGTNFRFGIDPIIGLMPGLGDAVGAALSGYIVYEAARMGLPRSVLVRMLSNVGVEVAVGMVPLLGDLFDATFKANVRNLRLIEGHFQRPVATRRSSRWFVAGVVAFAVVVLAGILALGYVILEGAARLLGA